MYLFKKVSQKFSKIKDYEKLIKPVISLVLVATSRVCLNSSISENNSIEIKEKVIIALKDTVTIVTTTKIKRSIFNVQYNVQGKQEIQVRWFVLYDITGIV